MRESTASSTTVFIAAISSDIGQSLACTYRARGWQVIGTYRDPSGLGALADDPGICLIQCDVADAHHSDP